MSRRNPEFTCPSCQRPLAKRHAVHNCLRVKRSDAGKKRKPRRKPKPPAAPDSAVNIASDAAWRILAHIGDSFTTESSVPAFTEIILDSLRKSAPSEESPDSKATDNGFDPAWLTPINNALADRGTGITLTDIDQDLWARFIGPMIDAIADGDTSAPRRCQ